MFYLLIMKVCKMNTQLPPKGGVVVFLKTFSPLGLNN